AVAIRRRGQVIGPIPCRASVCPRVAAAVDQQVLPSDEAGMLRAQERAIGAQLGWTAIAFGRIIFCTRTPKLVEALAGQFQHAAHVLALRVLSKMPGRRLLMVTLWATVCRARPPTNPTRPERAPLDSPSSSWGIFTLRETMLTMRPNP